MTAIRRDEDTDNIHSIYVDQWDWEKILTKEQRNDEFLKATVKAVYEALRVTEKYMQNEYEYIHDRLMAKAGYRIAALLNQILK